MSKNTSCNKVRRVQPSLPCVEGQQHLLSLLDPMTPCQGTPKNQPMALCHSLNGSLRQMDSHRFNSSCLCLSCTAACLPGPHSHCSPRFPHLHHHPQLSSAVPCGGSQESQQMAFPEHTELLHTGAISCYGILIEARIISLLTKKVR